MLPFVAAETIRLTHTAQHDRRYPHLHEEEKRSQASRLDEFVRRQLDSTWTSGEPGIRSTKRIQPMGAAGIEPATSRV